jgi:hypothetical protein
LIPEEHLMSVCLRSILGVGLVGFLFSAASAAATPGTMAGGGVQLAVDADAKIVGMAVEGHSLTVKREPLVTLCESGQSKWHGPTMVSGDPQHGMVMRFNEIKASATLTVQPADGSLRLACRVQGEPMAPRGLLLRIAIPLDALGWRWHQDMQSASVIEQGKAYEYVMPLRAWADMPEWKDQPDLRIGYSNRNFCTVLTGNTCGLCLAVPIDRPCVFRTAYRNGALELVYDFALAEQTRVPYTADVVFDLYACDPAWGLRDALARYYRLYPELFRNYVPRPGQWIAFSRLDDIDNANEFNFGLQEGAADPAYDNRLGVATTSYFTHAGMGANLSNYDPEKDPLPPYDVQVQAVEDAFKKRTGKEGVYAAVGVHNAQGKLDVQRWKVYAHLIAQFNLDPQLPYGKWTLENALAMIEQYKTQRHARLDGFYYDGLSTGLNYNAEHFRTANSLCLWDPVARKPLLNNFFSSCQFARAAAELVRPQGRVTMMNGALKASFFVAPWLDVLGSETGLRIPREDLNAIRATTYHKPFLTLLKGNFEQRNGHAEIERYMRDCLAYGVIPGFFDWSPSGLGPGGRYWDHPQYYERDRDLFRRYLPLCCSVAAAGWEPVPYAKASSPSVQVERFGPDQSGVTAITLLNSQKQETPFQLTIDARRLGLDPAQAVAIELLGGKRVTFRRQADTLVADLNLPADDLLVLQLGTARDLARWQIAQAVETVRRGQTMRQIDVDRPLRPVHWRPTGAICTRAKANKRPCLALTGNGRSRVQAEQWAMLFQSKPAPVTLRVRASADNVSVRKDKLGIELRLAWVTRQFTHYENRWFDLPVGTYENRDFEFSITSPQPLRAVLVRPTLGPRVQGSLRLSRVSLSDAAGDEYVVDPEFHEWYEPVPRSLRHPIEAACDAILGRLQQLDQQVGNRTECTRLIAEVSAQSDRLRKQTAGAGNGCRRVLRDLETLASHLELAGKIAGWSE